MERQRYTERESRRTKEKLLRETETEIEKDRKR